MLFGLQDTKMHFFCKIIVKFKYDSAHKGMHYGSKCSNHRKIKLLATFSSVLALVKQFYILTILTSFKKIYGTDGTSLESLNTQLLESGKIWKLHHQGNV